VKKGLMELMQSSCCWVVLWRIWGLVMRVGEGTGLVVERALALVTTGVVVFLLLEMEMWVFGGDSLFARGVEGIIVTRRGARYSLVSYTAQCAIRRLRRFLFLIDRPKDSSVVSFGLVTNRITFTQ